MNMDQIRDIQIKIRNKYSVSELSPEILCNIIHILFDYIDSNNQPERLNPEGYFKTGLNQNVPELVWRMSGLNPDLLGPCDSLNSMET